MSTTRTHLLAAAALLAAGAAQAQGASGVTLYGLFDAATRHASNVTATRGSLTTMEDGIMTGSRLGVRGREDLGQGRSLQFTLESGFDPSTGLSLQATPTADFGQVQSSTRFWGRESHVSLRDSWGGLTLGRQYTLAHTLAGRFQPQGNPNSAAHSLFSSHHVARQDNLARLDARLGGIDFAATHTFGEQAGSGANGAWALGAAVQAKDWSLAGYVQQMKNLAGTETRKIVGLGGNVRVSPTLQLFGGWMQRTNAVSPQDNRVITLGANVELSPALTLSLAHYRDEQGGSAALDGERSVSWAVLSYRFSRRSDVYLVLDSNRVTGGYAKPAFMGQKGSQSGSVVGLRHRF